MKNLLEIIDYVKPTALLGLSTISVSIHPYSLTMKVTNVITERLQFRRHPSYECAQSSPHHLPSVQPSTSV